MEFLNFENVFTLESLFTLFMLILLQAVLGFDNLLYISIESKRAPKEHQANVRKWGILIAVALRLVLLFVVMKVLDLVKQPLFTVNWEGYVEFEATLKALVELAGGAFLLYTAIREIMHMLAVEDLEGHEDQKPKSVAGVVSTIVLMNLIFSFDSILSALALTKVFLVMATAIVISGVMMVWLADHVSEFLKKNRMYEVLGLFILFVVGVMLISEGGHAAELTLFGNLVKPMAKSTFYFVIFVLVIVDIVQGRYQKKLMVQRKHELEKQTKTAPVA